jgi:hypothetical protein
MKDLSGAEPGSESGNGPKQAIGEVAEFARQVARFLREQIESESLVIATEQLDMASDKLDTLAEVLEEAVDKLREKQDDSLAGIMEIGSKSIMRLSGNLRKTSPDKIIGEMEDFARNKPGIFLGAAVAAGILLGRVFSTPGGRSGIIRRFHPGRESPIEYRRGRGKGEYHGPH